MDVSSSMDVKALLQFELYESFNRLTKVLAGMTDAEWRFRPVSGRTKLSGQ
jgi:hypothetical protein